MIYFQMIYKDRVRRFMLSGLALLSLLLLLPLGGCKGDEIQDAVTEKRVIEKRVAVVLPMESGLQQHWENIFRLLEHNAVTAFSSQDSEVILQPEFYDESTVDLEQLAGDLASRDDLYAVVGGLYSDDAEILARRLCSSGITFMTLATTEELVRAFASTGNLWALTETDITQSEVLLSKVVNYGGESVALIASDADSYGKTFVDWFAFQAKELGLEVKGIFNYGMMTIGEAAWQATGCGADYVIAAPSHIRDIMTVVDTFGSVSHPAPRLLFSDIGYGSDALALFFVMLFMTMAIAYPNLEIEL